MYGYWNRLTTRWSDNDCYGHVNNATYYTYIDTVVNNYLIDRGGLVPSESGTVGVVVQSQCRYARSFTYPQVIEAGLRVTHIGNRSVTYEVGMFFEGDPVAAVWGGFTHVFVDRAEQKPVTMPADIRRALEQIAGVDA